MRQFATFAKLPLCGRNLYKNTSKNFPPVIFCGLFLVLPLLSLFTVEQGQFFILSVCWQGILTLSPPQATTTLGYFLLDNDEVKVSEAIRSPGTIVPMHTHPKFFAYYIDATTVKLTAPDGKEAVKNIPAGKFLSFPDGLTHKLEIIGPANQHVIVVEFK